MAKAQSPVLRHLDESQEFYFKEGCHILEMWNDAADPDCSIARARVSPGQQTRWHSLTGVTERYVILSGQGQVEVGDKVETVTEGAVVMIPEACPQRIRNTGEQPLVFLALCTPCFSDDCYIDLEDERA